MAITNTSSSLTTLSNTVTLDNMLSSSEFSTSKQYLRIELSKDLVINTGTTLKIYGLNIVLKDKRIYNQEHSNPTLIEGVTFTYDSSTNNHKMDKLALKNCVINMGRTGNDGCVLSQANNVTVCAYHTGATTGDDRPAVLFLGHTNRDEIKLFENVNVYSPGRIALLSDDRRYMYGFYLRKWEVNCDNGSERSIIFGMNQNPDGFLEDVTVTGVSKIEGLFYNNGDGSDRQAKLVFAGTSIDSFFRNGENSDIPLSFHNYDYGKNRTIRVGGVKYWNIVNGENTFMKIFTNETDDWADKLEIGIDSNTEGFITGNTQININSDSENIQFFVPTGRGSGRRYSRFSDVPSIGIFGYYKNIYYKEFNSSTTTLNNFHDAERTEGNPLAYSPIILSEDTNTSYTEKQAGTISSVSVNHNTKKITIEKDCTENQFYDWLKYQKFLQTVRILDTPVRTGVRGDTLDALSGTNTTLTLASFTTPEILTGNKVIMETGGENLGISFGLEDDKISFYTNDSNTPMITSSFNFQANTSYTIAFILNRGDGSVTFYAKEGYNVQLSTNDEQESATGLNQNDYSGGNAMGIGIVTTSAFPNNYWDSFDGQDLSVQIFNNRTNFTNFYEVVDSNLTFPTIETLVVRAEGKTLLTDYDVTINSGAKFLATEKFNRLESTGVITNNGESDVILRDKNGTKLSITINNVPENYEVTIGEIEEGDSDISSYSTEHLHIENATESSYTATIIVDEVTERNIVVQVIPDIQNYLVKRFESKFITINTPIKIDYIKKELKV